MSAPSRFEHVAYLSGGVGGARLLDGMARVLPPQALSAIVNTGDDLTHWGLRVCPDIDTVLYTLSGLGDAKRGWGLRGETFRALEGVARYGGERWFALGDRDLATHIVRSERLRAGQTLTAVTDQLARALGIECAVLPMCDEPRETCIDSERDGVLGFQEWLVHRRAEPQVRAVQFRGDARPTAQVLAALERAQLVVIGPSNPYVSVDPILSLPGLRDALSGKRVVALSPIVGGKAVKGPLGEMIPALAGRPASAAAIAAHYAPLLTGMVVEHGDGFELEGLRVLQTGTVMHTSRDRVRLARELLAFAAQLP
jgi:LPPG:FO 2-phospho-L-lactate transferase